MGVDPVLINTRVQNGRARLDEYLLDYKIYSCALRPTMQAIVIYKDLPLCTMCSREFISELLY